MISTPTKAQCRAWVAQAVRASAARPQPRALPHREWLAMFSEQVSLRDLL